MKIKVIFLILSLFLLFSKDVYSSPISFEKQKNSSGEITITLLPVNSDIIYIVLSFKTGSVRDPIGKEGLNYITSTIIEKNINKELNDKASTSGAVFFTRTDKEITTYFFKCHKNKFALTYPIFISGIISPKINDTFLELAKDSALNLRDNTLESSEELSLEGLELFIYRNHSYGTSDFGTKKSIENITIDDIKDFYQKFYTSKNYQIGIACTNPSGILEKIKADFVKLSQDEPEGIIVKGSEKYSGTKVLIIKKDVPTTAIALGFPIDCLRSDEDYYPLLIANSNFGQHRYMHGFLFRQLREKRGLNYGDYSYIEKFAETYQDKMPHTRIARHRQYFYVWLRNLPNENACFGLKFTIMFLKDMINQGLSDENFTIMKDFVVNNSKLWDFDPFQKLGFSMDSDFYHTPYFIYYIEKMLATVRNEDVSLALKKVLGSGNIKVVMVTGDPEKLKNYLLGNIDCTPVYKTTLPEEDKKIDEEVIKYNLKLVPEDIEIVNSSDMF